MMSRITDQEPWLRGPIAGVPRELMPVAHSLQQGLEELPEILRDFPAEALWHRPGGAASIGFHLKHLAGSLDRLFTYARGEALNEQQIAHLRTEKDETRESIETLLAKTLEHIRQAQRHLMTFDPSTLFDERKVGRAGLPSTCIGLLFHAAEHMQRHIGAIIATVRVVKAQ